MEISEEKPFERIINGKRYSTKGAMLLADDVYWDGHNMDRHGRNCFLYKTKKGNYFAVYLTRWVNESNDLKPIKNEEEARNLYENLEIKRVSYETAFPNFNVIDA